MSCQFLHFSVIDSCDVGLNGNSSVSSELLCSHESIAWLVILIYMHCYHVRLPTRARCFKNSHHWCEMSPYNVFHAVHWPSLYKGLHLFLSKTLYTFSSAFKDGNNTVLWVKSDCVEGGKCRRIWARTIYIVQTEDSLRYGTQFQTIPHLQGSKDLPSMMVWFLAAMLSLIKELWHAVDNIVGPFWCDQWEGYILTWVQKQIFSYEHFKKDSWSPFDYLNSTALLRKFVDSYPWYNFIDDNDPSSSLGTWWITWNVCSHNQEVPLFTYAPLSKMPCNLMSYLIVILMIRISSFVLGLAFLNPFFNNKSNLKLSTNIFELWYISLLQQTTQTNNCSKWHSECYARHGGGYISWWYHMRGDHLARKYCVNIATHLPQCLISKDLFY